MNNATIAGIGTISGGEYDKITISGTGSVNGNIKANEIKISGVANFNGETESISLKVSGVGKFDQNVKCKTFHTSGVAKLENDLSADSITVNGTIHISGDINTDILVIDTKESCLENVYGDCINIKASKNVKVNEIEATNIILTNATVKRVSGSKVEIYEYSHVDVVEYSDSLKIHDTCVIRQVIKL